MYNTAKKAAKRLAICITRLKEKAPGNVKWTPQANQVFLGHDSGRAGDYRISGQMKLLLRTETLHVFSRSTASPCRTNALGTSQCGITTGSNFWCRVKFLVVIWKVNMVFNDEKISGATKVPAAWILPCQMIQIGL